MIEWVKIPDLAELAAEFCRRLRKSADRLHGSYPVALTGGGSAAAFYDALAADPEHAPELTRIRFFWSDERLVPKAHPDSNFKLAADHLLRPVDIPDRHVFAPDTHLEPEEAAAAYAELIRDQVPAGVVSTPQFPLILLGLGEDGHTASLFPGRDPYLNDDLLVRAVAETAAHPHARLTFTPRLINAATQVWFVVTGEKKAWALEQLARRTATPMEVPALAVDPAWTNVTIFSSVGS